MNITQAQLMNIKQDEIMIINEHVCYSCPYPLRGRFFLLSVCTEEGISW